MERKERKRKAQEITESPRFVSEKINELTVALAESDAILRKEISDLRDEVGRLEKYLTDKNEECNRLQAEVDFLHPDAVIDRIRTKLWYHGDLSVLRRAIEPRTRVLRSMEGRSDRCLFLCSTPTKKGGSKAPMNGVRAIDFSPKHESEEASMPTTATAEPVGMNAEDSTNAEKKQQESDEEFVSVPPASEIDAQAKLSSQKEATNGAVAQQSPNIDAMNEAVTQPSPNIDAMTDALMDCAA